MLTIKNEGTAGIHFSELRVENAQDYPRPALRMELRYRGRPSGNVVLFSDSVRAFRDQLDAWLKQNVTPASGPVVSGSLV